MTCEILKDDDDQLFIVIHCTNTEDTLMELVAKKFGLEKDHDYSDGGVGGWVIKAKQRTA